MTQNWRGRIVKAIAESGYSQRELARRANVSPSFINELITMDKEPGAVKLLALIRALDMSVTFAFTGVELSQDVEDFAGLLERVPVAERKPLLEMLRSRTSTEPS